MDQDMDSQKRYWLVYMLTNLLRLDKMQSILDVDVDTRVLGICMFA